MCSFLGRYFIVLVFLERFLFLKVRKVYEIDVCNSIVCYGIDVDILGFMVFLEYNKYLLEKFEGIRLN